MRDALPYRVFEARRRRLFARLAERPENAADLFSRVRYYNKMSPGGDAEGAIPIRSIPLKHSYYYYDLKGDAKHFGPHRRLRHRFGDVIRVPPEPTIVKSRPVGGDNANSVVMKLDRLRHFFMPRDDRGFDDKQPFAVWRGSIGNPARMRLVERFVDHPRHDIGFSAGSPPGLAKARLSIRDHLAFRYVISVEGNDVATNLKWIMASNSVCLMPRPRFETWFMEGRLVPGVHYVELQDDFADLEEKVAFCEANPEQVMAIVANAQRHVYQFTRPDCESQVSLLVLQKYLECTGQIDPEPFSSMFYDAD